MTINDIIALLQREYYETEAGYDAIELASRRGWNSRARTLIVALQVAQTEQGLAELAAAAPFTGEAP